MQIEIQDLTKSRINKKRLKKLAKRILKEEKSGQKIKISITIIDKEKIRELNKKYKKRDKETNVLAFEIPVEGKNLKLCDIYISVDEARKYAKELKESLIKNIARLMIHGILHTLGYNHGKEMEEKENYYLSKL